MISPAVNTGNTAADVNTPSKFYLDRFPVQSNTAAIGEKPFMSAFAAIYFYSVKKIIIKKH
jgi:hypothetical protein